MKLVFAADLHLKAKRPMFRKDEYWMTSLRKLREILRITEENDGILVLGGDVFDSPNGAIWYLNAVMATMLDSTAAIFAVAGNHDQYFHNPDISKTQLGNLVVSGALTILREEHSDFGGMHGRSWNEPYPEGSAAILVAHATVTNGTPPPWLTAQSAEDFIDSHPGYELIVTGDFHEKFVVHHNGTTLINTGPMMRASVDKVDFKPACWIYDTETKTVTEMPLHVEDDVFDMDLSEASKDSANSMGVMKEQWSKFMDSMSKTSEKPNFRAVIEAAIAKIPAEKTDLLNELEEILDHASGN